MTSLRVVLYFFVRVSLFLHRCDAATQHHSKLQWTRFQWKHIRIKGGKTIDNHNVLLCVACLESMMVILQKSEGVTTVI